MTTTVVRAYDDTNYTVRRLTHVAGHGPTASVVQAAVFSPVDMLVHRVGGIAAIAGTTATNTYTVRNGTTSVGLITLADSAALFTNTAEVDVTVTAGTSLNFLKGTDATGVADFFVEYSIPVGQNLPA
jgi:hypothetical protein